MSQRPHNTESPSPVGDDWFVGPDECLKLPARSTSPSVRSNTSGGSNLKVPVAYTENSSQQFGFNLKKASARNIRLGREMESLVVGPMPVKDFLETFFTASEVAKAHQDMPSPENAFVHVKADQREIDIYKPLVQALNADPDTEPPRPSRCPGFHFRDTSAHADQSRGKVGSKKPDVCCYAARDLPAAEMASKDFKSRTDMGFAATFFEIKRQVSMDLFSDPPRTADRASWSFVLGNHRGATLDKGREDFGQNIAYVAEVFMRQHRHCVYSITISGTRVRLMRWDRAGVIVTEAFDIHTHPEILCTFLWCFAHVSDAVRGYDPTAEPATGNQETIFRKAVEQHVAAQLSLSGGDALQKALEDHYHPTRVTSIYIPRQTEGEEGDYLLVSRPVSVPLSVVGRSTRAHWAVNTRSKAVLFLKDTWRYGTREGAIIQSLRDKGVSHIPPVEYHGDVPMHSGHGVIAAHGAQQTTLTQKYLDEWWVCGDKAALARKIIVRVRYRLVLGIAGYSLMNLSGTRELLHGAHHAFIALKEAYNLGQVHHRDVNPGNIVLFRDVPFYRDIPSGSISASTEPVPRVGYLVDWELSCSTESPDTLSYEHEASMAWQFLSTLVAQRASNRYRIQDDMESLYYVVLYCGILYLPHALPPDQLLGMLQELFDWNGEGGGTGKSGDLYTAVWSRRLDWGCTAMKSWLDSVRSYIREYLYLWTPDSDPQNVGSWTLAAFDEHWRTFFAGTGKVLPDRDRTDHIKNSPHIFMKHAPFSASGIPNQPTIATGTKRGPVSPPSGDLAEPAHKRRRATKLAGTRAGRSPASAGSGKAWRSPNPTPSGTASLLTAPSVSGKSGRSVRFDEGLRHAHTGLSLALALGSGVRSRQPSASGSLREAAAVHDDRFLTVPLSIDRGARNRTVAVDEDGHVDSHSETAREGTSDSRL